MRMRFCSLRSGDGLPFTFGCRRFEQPLTRGNMKGNKREMLRITGSEAFANACSRNECTKRHKTEDFVEATPSYAYPTSALASHAACLSGVSLRTNGTDDPPSPATFVHVVIACTSGDTTRM